MRTIKCTMNEHHLCIAAGTLDCDCDCHHIKEQHQNASAIQMLFAHKHECEQCRSSITPCQMGAALNKLAFESRFKKGVRQ